MTASSFLPSSKHRRALDLVLRHGWDATAFQTLAEGYDYFFDEDACVAYVDTGAAWVAAGPPIAASERLLPSASAFVRAAHDAGRRCCFFGAEPRFVQASIGRLCAMQIGRLPVWNPGDWSHRLRQRASLREQLRRANAKCVRVRMLHGSEGDHGDLRLALDRLTRVWLASHRMPAMGFLLGMSATAFPERRHRFVAERFGDVVGMAHVIPVPGRGGWFIEHLVRDASAPNGTVEALIDAVMRWAAEQGSSWLTLGLAPLSGNVSLPLRLARDRLGFLYDFNGLEQFRAKLGPRQWLGVYLSYPSSQGPVMTIVDVLAAFAHARARLPGAAPLLRQTAA